ncbi:MAG: site-specific DNA-methyltransferase [Pseudomonadota bacterium]
MPATVPIPPPAGRVLLVWAGKRAPAEIAVPEVRPSERCDPEGGAAARGGLLFQGDNAGALAHLLARGLAGKVDLVAIDPPFDSGRRYVRRATLRGGRGSASLPAESPFLGAQVQYGDAWSEDSYLQFMYERLLMLRALLAEEGSLYLHCDFHRTHHLRCLLEEVFGAANVRNEIIWQRFNFRADGKKFGTVHDTIYFVTKGPRYHFAKPSTPLKPSYVRSHFRPDERGRLYRLDNLSAPAHGRTGKALRFGDRLLTPPPGTMWRHAQEGLDRLWEAGRIELNATGVPQVRRYLDEMEGQAVHSLWTDIGPLNSQARERTSYDTQKPEALLERIIGTSSSPGDLVLDCFAGSGTAAVVAQRMGRRWIACDANPGAIQTTSARLQRQIFTAGGPGFTTWQVGPAAPVAGSGEEATAEVIVRRDGDALDVRILGFRSPALARGLEAAGLPRPADWRAGVERVLIDPAWDGRVFDVALADAPARRALVAGAYRLRAPTGPSTVAVRVVDVLGQEWTVTREV